MPLTLITPPAETPVTLAEVKAHLRIDHSDEDSVLDGMLAAAVDHLDGWRGVLGRCLVTQVWQQSFDRFAQTMIISLGDVQTIGAIDYLDSEGQPQTADVNDFVMVASGGCAALMPKKGVTLPVTDRSPDNVKILYTAGFGAASDVPNSIKQALLLLIGHWYENREAVTMAQNVTALPMGVDALIAPLRMRTL